MTAESQAAVMERAADKRKAMYEELRRKHRETSPCILMFRKARQTGLRANVQNFQTGGAVYAAACWLATN